MKSKLILALAIVFVVLGAGSVMAEFSQSSGGGFNSHSSSTYQGSYTGSFYTREQVGQYWPILANEEKEACESRQDILINVVPAGCQPTVVRSDLLAEQNVPVFCQLNALTLNPFIDIKQIRNIRFSGKYPEGVVGVGFHPARAALNSRDSLIGDPIINNIGYVVVLLKKEPVESKLPDFVNFTLTAHIDYYADNAFGVGKAEFNLKEMSDEQWEDKSNRESFYKGNYYVRLEEADPERAVVSFYSQDRRVSSVSVEKGKESRLVYLPGLYCRSGIKVAYDSFVGDVDRARIEIRSNDGTDSLDVNKGSKFLNDRCDVRDLKIYEDGSGYLDINCPKKRFRLEISNRTVEGVTLHNKGLGASENKVNDAIDSYVEVSEVYPFDKKVDSDVSEPFGQTALKEADRLAELTGQELTRKEILQKLVDTYSLDREYYSDELSRFVKYNLTNSIDQVQIDNKYYTIRVVKFKKISEDRKSKAVFSVNGNTFEVIQGNTKEVKTGGVEGIYFDQAIDAERVRANIICSDKEKTGGTRTFVLGEVADNVCGAIVKFERGDINEVAKIRLVPRTDGTKTQTNFSVGVGIEKRAIKLSPEKALEKAENLNESIQKWEAISKRLANVVSGMKAACFATSAVLTVKNFVSGLDGTALARQQTMQGEFGWSQRCKDALESGFIDRNSNGKQDATEAVSYGSTTQCFNDEKANIEREIEARKQAISSRNDLAKNIEGSPGVTTQAGFLGGSSVVDSEKAKNILCERMNSEYGSVEEFKKTFGNAKCDENFPATYNELLEWKEKYDLSERGIGQKEFEVIDERINEYKKFIAQKAADQGQTIVSTKVIVNDNAREVSTKIWDIMDVEGKKKVEEYTLIGINVDDKSNQAILVYAKKDISKENGESEDYLVTGNLLPTGYFDPVNVYLAEIKEKNINLNPKLGVQPRSFLSSNAGISGVRSSITKLSGNKIRDSDQVVRYFGSGADKDLPSLVPFDLNNGWYVRVISGVGENKAYDSSGLPKSWRISNVGEDGRIDPRDKYTTVTRGYASDILGLDRSQSEQLVRNSERALLDAARQRDSKVVTILDNIKLNQGSDVSHLNSNECQDFMSIDDCKLLFNVCDPVICPASRCNLGGEYQVADVIQTGIVGSAVLCLPNAKEGVFIPVCLTGIQAGIDSYVSILKNYRDCLNENVESGKMVGICDTIYSVYTCEFFWNQVAPVVNILLPKMIQYAYGGGQGGARGGGEYLTVMGAWQNTQNSINYFKQQYAVNSLKAFNIRSTEEAGTQFCKAFISAKAPSSFKTLIEPDSPPQFYAWYSSSKFNDATVPATSRYKVFFHIYAGKDSGVTYSVYLKNPPQSSLFYQNERVSVKTGFITKGQYASETVDFTAPEGYSELCVRVNDQEECGFKQVSTDFAVNYVRDELVKDELTNNQIKSEQECISGGVSALQVLQPNIQDAAEDSLNPNIRERGIVRICSSINPGASTEPLRYQEVGYCENQNVKCWLDKKSVDNAITDANVGAKKETITELEDQAKVLKSQQGNFVGSEAVELVRKAREEVDKIVKKYEINKEVDANGIVEVRKYMDENFGVIEDRLLLGHHKAEVALLRARLNGVEARAEYDSVAQRTSNSIPTEPSKDSSNEDKVEKTQEKEIDYFSFRTGKIGATKTPTLEILYNENGEYRDTGLYVVMGSKNIVHRGFAGEIVAILSKELPSPFDSSEEISVSQLTSQYTGKIIVGSFNSNNLKELVFQVEKNDKEEYKIKIVRGPKIKS